MMTWDQIKAIQRARRAGAPLGDIAVMKFAMLHDPSPAQEAALRGAGEPCLDTDLASLRALPDGTLGREYARHLDDNGLAPLAVSPEVRRRYADRPYALRFTTTHDLMHTATGFPTTPAGEIGLFAFMIGQGFAGGSLWRLWSSAAIYVLFMPLHARGVIHNARLGLAMGRRAKDLLAAPLQDWLAEPLAVVRRRLGVPEPAQAGILPGHASWLYAKLLPKPMLPKPAEAAAT